MSLPRFYISPEKFHPDALALEGDEAHHCTAVMRRRAGDHIMVFDGSGKRAEAQIVSSNGRQLELRCVKMFQMPPPAFAITLVQAVPKGANMEIIIEKAVELGVNEIVPVLTERTVVRLDAKEAVKKQEKWQRIALAACKQCGQDCLPRVHAPLLFDQVWPALPAHSLRLVAALQDDALPLKAILAARSSTVKPAVESVLVLVGPEGDLTAEEYAVARAQGCLPMTLGPIVMRVETASLFCLSVLSYELRP